MKIVCKECKNIVVEGEIVKRKNKQKFDIFYKPKGTILKNNSNNPKDWKGLCSIHQKFKRLEDGE